MIRLTDVTKRYGAVTAVDRLSFAVEPGETFALIGPNGAGKTTTLKLILGLARPTSGVIAVGPDGGLPPHDAATRRGLGYVPQRVELPAGRTAAEVLGFFASLRGLPAEAVPRALERVGMTDLAGRRASELSGGFAQRLLLAQALLGEPSLLVLDEPTASLDPEATWEFRSLVEGLRRDGKTILLCSHLLAEVERIADRVLILAGGRGVALESLADLRARQASSARLEIEARNVEAAGMALSRRGIDFIPWGERRVAIEGANGRGVAALEALREAGVEIRSFELTRPTLEEIFLAAVRGERDGAAAKRGGVKP